MRVIYHNWSATKQHPHPQSVAEISRHEHHRATDQSYYHVYYYSVQQEGAWASLYKMSQPTHQWPVYQLHVI